MMSEIGATFFSSGKGFCPVSGISEIMVVIKSHLDLVRDIEGVCVTLISEVDADQGIDQIISIIGNTIERIAEVGMWILDTGSSSQYNESGYDDKEQDDQLH